MTETKPSTKPVAERETSIRRGIEVLLSLASVETIAAGGLRVTRIAELLGREKSQVSRALKALREYGLVERNRDLTYRLGWRLFALAQFAGEMGLLEAAAPRLRRLAVSLGERAHLSVPHGTQTLTLLSESPGRAVETAGWAGLMTPAYCTSAGRALLLDTPAQDIERTFAGVEFLALGPRTVRSPAELAKRVDWARTAGYVVVDEEFEPDFLGVAVPIRDPKDRIIASIDVSAPRFRFLERVEGAAQELLETAAAVARHLDRSEEHTTTR